MSNRSVKKKHETEAAKIERTGEKDFIVKHDDGSHFECKVDDPRRFDGIKGLKANSTLFSFGGFGKKKPLICDSCNKVVHKLTGVEGNRMLCTYCI